MASIARGAFRLSVEVVLVHESKVLVTKRADSCSVAPGVWNVPAGKVDIGETTFDAVIRETREEVGINVFVVKILSETATTVIKAGVPASRNIFTYHVETEGTTEVVLNEEHSEYAWVSAAELADSKYDSMLPRLRKAILTLLPDVSKK
ncbi:MAG: NUDIX domain-containing protein [Rhabdochlamydiaceae bacterium]|nr:NUDIX domain-containing protein [Candidatus Amphrikana amoebophyrae]